MSRSRRQLAAARKRRWTVGRTGFHIGSVAMFLAKVCSRNGKPDRYAAAICIRVRRDLFVARIFWRRKLAPVRAAKGVTDLRRYPDATRFSSNGYFFFFLADFFAFFAFFAFLAMLPSVTPKLAQCKSTFDMHSFRLHHDCKIDTARFEEGKRPATSSRLATRTKLSRDAWTHAPCWIKRGRSSHVVGRRSRRWEA